MKCFETIKVLDGRPYHIDYHNRRCNETRKALFGSCNQIDLSSFITPPSKGLYRCKVIYDHEVRSVTFFPYTPRVVKSLKLLHTDIDYPYKYLDRRELDEAFAQRGDADDILIVKEGLLTDTSIANIALLYKGEWLTPHTPLLAGTTRARLLEQKRIHPAYIEAQDIAKFNKIALLNAMIGFFELEECIIF